jgi:signal transduction histidine kinase/CheY-like chemotaxis protein
LAPDLLTARYRAVERRALADPAGAAAGPAAADASAVAGAARRVSRAFRDERIRLYLQPDAVQVVRGFRNLQLLAIAGAAAVAAVTSALAGPPLPKLSAWCALVFATEASITAAVAAYHKHPRGRETLDRWARLKTAAAFGNALAWGLGPVFLHVPGAPISVLAPVWAIVIIIASALTLGASYVPALVAVVLGTTVPACAWLASFGSGIELAAGVCLGVALPFILVIGYFSVQETGRAIAATFRISELLGIQTEQTRMIREEQAERNRFFSAASHDLRQPLHALGLYLSVLPRAASEAEAAELRARLSECASSLDRQFGAIMGVANTDAILEPGEGAASPLQDSFDRVRATFAQDADLKSLRFRIARTSLWTGAPPEILERALSNLVSNAIKYTPAGGVLVGARRAGNVARVLVADTGIGIAGDDMAAIFKDFLQLANPARDREKGFGLGLGIARRLCERMNWGLEVSSSVGRGSVFSIEIPLAAKPAREAAPAAAAGVAFAPGAGDASIVIVDDDEWVRDATRKLLATWNMEAAICATGDEALAIMRAAGPARRWRALLDYRLAGEANGLALADAIAAEFGARARVSLMSGETNDGVFAGAELRGLPLLRKPIKPIRLRALLTAP